MDLSIPYYEDNTRISNSAIGWFLKNGPIYLHEKLTGKIPEEKYSFLEKGTMIHEYILQPELFDKDYIVFNGTKPSSDNQDKFCKELINSTEIEPDKALLTAYKASYSIIGKSDEKMLSEAKKLAKNLNDYIEALNDGRTIISNYDLLKCKNVFYNIKDHKFASKIINTKDDKWEEYHEFHINWEYNGIPCKSLLDCVKFNFKESIVELIDLKTTTNLWKFQTSIEKYDYLRQLCFYKEAIKWYLENIRGEYFDDWTIDYYIIAIDSTSKSDIRVFKFDPYVVNSRLHIIQKALENISWHTINNKWEHSKEYYLSDGCETLSEFV